MWPIRGHLRVSVPLSSDRRCNIFGSEFLLITLDSHFEIAQYFRQPKPRVNVSRQRIFYMNVRVWTHKYCYSNISAIYAKGE